MSDTLVSMADVPIGCRAKVYNVTSGEPRVAFDNLIDLGFAPGRWVTIVFRPPGGATMARVDGAHAVMVADVLARGVLCQVRDEL
tara:strand:+ start:654 stop:908 length:255 start_codon:yes stop_codon:yes gene_type:complete